MRVYVTFTMEPSDPDHVTGLTAEDYDDVSDAVMGLGGENLDVRLEDEE